MPLLCAQCFSVFDPLFSYAVVFRHMKDQEALLTEQWHEEKDLGPRTSDLRPKTQRKSKEHSLEHE